MKSSTNIFSAGLGAAGVGAVFHDLEDAGFEGGVDDVFLESAEEPLFPSAMIPSHLVEEDQFQVSQEGWFHPV